MQRLGLFVKRSGVALTRSPMASISNKGAWDEREQSQEKVYFNKEEEKLLKKLTNRLSQERYSAESGKGAQEFKSEQIRRLKEIFSRYRVNCDNEAVFDELYAWKHDE